MKATFRPWLSAGLVLACAGCGQNIYPVSGRVTCNGAPASGAVVSFHRQGGDSCDDPSIMGLVKEDGSFELVCGSWGKGAPPGQYDVAIWWRDCKGCCKNRSKRALDDIRREVADLTIMATEKVTRKTLNDADQRRLVEEALGELDFSGISSDAQSN